jgi:hypothetical protein
MAGEGIFFTAAVVYGLIAFVKRAVKTAQEQGRPLDMSGVSGGRSRAPQTMEELLQEMRGQLDGAKRHREIEEATVHPGPAKRLPGPRPKRTVPTATVTRLPPTEREPWAVEEGQSLEVGARPIAVEEIGARPVPQRIDYDDDAEALVQRRVTAAQKRDGAMVPDDHRRFDTAIRSKTPVKAAAPETQAMALRRAMIWHEVLSPPLSLRDGD